MVSGDMSKDASSAEYAGKIQLQKYGRFLQKYHEALVNIQEDWVDQFPNVDQANPTFLQIVPYEQASLMDLSRSENRVLGKVILVLSSLCAEVDHLRYQAETKFYPALLLYAEGTNESEDAAEASAQLSMARMLACLQELSSFVERCYEVVRNILHQLASLYSQNINSMIVMNEVHFEVIFESLGDLLKILLILDEILLKHPTLLDHWKTYVRTIKLVHHNPDKVDTSREKMKPLETLLEKLDAQLMSGYILQNCCEQPFDTGEISVTRNSRLVAEFITAIKTFFAKIEKHLGEPGETLERSRLLSICCLCIFHLYAFRAVDKKTYKAVLETYKKVPVVHLVGDIFWSPVEFFFARFPAMDKALDKKVLQQADVAKVNALNHRIDTFPRDCEACVVQVSEWLVKMKCVRAWTNNITQDMEIRCKLLLQGVKYAFAINHLVKTMIGLHVSQKRPMAKTSVLLIFKLVELVKAVQLCFQSHWLLVAESLVHIQQHCASHLIMALESCKNRLQSDVKRFSERRLDILSAISMAENALTGPAAKERILVLKLALAIASQSKTFSSDELSSIAQLVFRLEQLTLFVKRIEEGVDCSFLYWQRNLINVYFEDVVNDGTLTQGLQYVVYATNDIVPWLRAVCHTQQSNEAITRFEQEYVALVKEHLLDKLCQCVETDLRLSIHSHLQLDDRNPFRTPLASHKALLHQLPMRFANATISIKRHVERYLERTFYNLTTVALSDWRTYAEMAVLAKQKYGLQLVEAHLPCQQLEQGLDVLEIMRNIHIFVVKYMYNLNNQMFVEKGSNNKHLNTINIKHVANSIRTHGTGIMNTTINFTYQFLRKKFYILSQFLFDEQIKSRLLKDARYFREHKEELHKMYPFEKAEKFNRGIRRLGLTGDGLSYLDQFRILITQIGNAMGYVRMVRSGGLQCCAQSIQFIPDLEDVVQFQPYSTQAQLNQQSIVAAERLDSVIANLTKSFDEGTNYFRLLVEVFAPEFRSSKNLHLRNFYIIVPPLTVNFVEHMISCKEKIWKKSATGAAFTDDGFAMGVAYVLKLLDQYPEFDSLHWFESVRTKYTFQKAEVQKQAMNAGTDEKLRQTIMLTIKRIDQYLKEFQFLEFSLSSARIFFRSEDVVTPPSDDGGSVKAKSIDAASQASTGTEINA